MEEEIPSSINSIRSAKRCDLKDLRSRHKEVILSHRRIGLQEISEQCKDVSLAEFKELLLNLKRKGVSIDVLKKIKNSCVSLEYIEAVFKSDGIINSFVRLLTGKDGLKQLEAAACLVNLACAPHKCCYKIGKAAGAYFVCYMCGSCHFLQDLSAWAVGNIANDCLECYKLIKAQGALPALLKLLESHSSSVVQSAVFALNACTKYEDPDIISEIQSGLLKSLYRVMEREKTNQSLFLDAAFTLSNCCYLSTKYDWEVFDAKAIETIIRILNEVTEVKDFDVLVAIPLIRGLGFLSYTDEICQLISNHAEFCSSIQTISVSDCLPLKRELIWVLTNLTASKTNSTASLYLPLIIDSLPTFLKMENSAILQVLYYLLCSVSTDVSTISLLQQHEIFSQIQCLTGSQQSDVSQAAKQFLEVTQCLINV